MPSRVGRRRGRFTQRAGESWPGDRHRVPARSRAGPTHPPGSSTSLTVEPSAAGATNVAVVPNGSSTSATNTPPSRSASRSRPGRTGSRPTPRAQVIPASGFGAMSTCRYPGRRDIGRQAGHVSVDPVDDRSIGVVVEREHVRRLRSRTRASRAGAVMVPGWIEPSGRIASQRSQTVVAPMAHLVQPRGHLRPHEHEVGLLESTRRPRVPGARAACPGTPSRTRPSDCAHELGEGLADTRARSSSGTRSKRRATAQPVCVVTACSAHALHVAAAHRARQRPVLGRRLVLAQGARSASAASRALCAKNALAR